MLDWIDMQEIINTLITDHNRYVESINFWDEFKSWVYPIPAIISLVTIVIVILCLDGLFNKILVSLQLILTLLVFAIIVTSTSYLGNKYLHNDADRYIAKNLNTVSTQNGFNIYLDDKLKIMTVNTETGKYTSESLSGLQYAALNDELVNQFGVNTAIKIISNNKIYNKHNNLEMKFVHKEKYYILVTSTHNHIINVNVK